MSTTNSLPAFVTAPSKQPLDDGNSAESEKLVITYDDNHLVSLLFGQFDEHLAIIERDLNIQAVTRGNQVTLSGSQVAIDQARLVLDTLYQRITSGEEVRAADVEGAVNQIAGAKAKTRIPKKNADKSAGHAGGLSMASISTAKKTIHARTPTQNAYIRAMENREMVFGTGPAGTGKTYLAVAYAASLLERGAVDRIILSRPAVEAGERLGFLPGDMKDKVDPYLRPLYDALYDMIPGDKVERAINSDIIEIAPLAFMRGRTLAHAAVILDEAQNTTTMQMKMFLTRLGEGSKMIITGDPSQIDLPPGQKSGLVQALDILDHVDGIESIEFTAGDVVRHKLVGRIVEAYDEAGREASQSR